MTAPIRLLLLEDDPADAGLVRHMLARISRGAFEVAAAGRLSQALALLAEGGVDVVLADLGVPDSTGLATLKALTGAAPDLPVVVLTGNDDSGLALEALKHGAQDYLVKGVGDGHVLARVLRYAIERKAGERTLKEALDRAEAAAHAKSVFLAMMGHEIRTPLNGVLGMARLLLDTRLDDRQRSFVQTIVGSGELLLGLVNDILDFSRLEADGLTLDEEPVDVADALEELRLLLAPRAAEKGIELAILPGPPLPPVMGDPLRLRQVLLNLIGNAIKFTERGGVECAVARLGRTEGAERLRFSVADTGIGVSEKVRPSLFTEFFQGDSAITRRFGGTGLGLAICKRLVTLMGGEIGFDSREGGGSLFWFEIPFRPAPEGAWAPRDAMRTGPLVPRRVLLVDDNAINREVAAGLMESCGHRAVAVDCGARAVEEAAKGGFDLVLLDLLMPDMDGIETARRIRALAPPASQVPIYLLTANPRHEESRIWRAAGIDGCLAKPFRGEEVAQLLAGGGGARYGAGRAARPVLDRDEFEADCRALGAERMRALVETFRESSRLDLDTALGAGEDCRRLAQSAHRLASAAASLHLAALTERCRAIETACRDRKAPPPTLVDGLDKDWKAGLAALDQALGEITPR